MSIDSFDDRVRKLNRKVFNKGSYSVEEVCEMLGIARQTVYKLINKGCFKAVKVERGYRIIKSSFDEWLDNE